MNFILSLLQKLRVRAMILFTTLLLSIVSGCTFIETEKEPTLSISPVELFEGDNRKFQPFLGSFSGGVNLVYSGEKKNLEVIWEVWENGERAFNAGKMSDIFFHYEEGEIIKDYTKELIASIKPININDTESVYEIIIALSGDTGSSSYSSMLEKEEKYNVFSFETIHESSTIKVGEKKGVMALYASSSNSLETYSSYDEAKQKAEWLLVLSIAIKDE